MEYTIARKRLIVMKVKNNIGSTRIADIRVKALYSLE